MNLRNLYEESYAFLIGEAVPFISKDRIDDFITNPDIKDCRDIYTAYNLFLAIMQDFNMYPNVIKFDKRKNQIIRILHNCDLKYISSLNPENLLLEFKKEFAFQKETLWLKYCRSIISGAKFMSRFQDDNDFIDTFKSFDKNDMTREAFALFLSCKIYNMGFAIACNWLKELGYYKYAKPDTHTKDICKALNLISGNDDIECFEIMTKIADEANVDAYKVDKIWWLICSGNFYRYNIILPNPRQRKDHFLNYIKTIK